MTRSLVFAIALVSAGFLAAACLPAQAAQPVGEASRTEVAAAPRATENPMRFALVAAAPACDHCLVVNASGAITDQTSRDFSGFIAGLKEQGLLPVGRPTPAGPRVILGLESPGGKVLSALVMGRRIRELGWTTVVGQGWQRDGRVGFESAGCYSACSMVMLGGVERLVVPHSRPGIHQFSPLFGDTETFSAAQMNDIVRDYGRQVVTVYEYVREMGADLSFFIETMRTPFNGMDVVPQSQWKRLSLATRLLPERTDPARASVQETLLTDILGESPAGQEVPVAAAASAGAQPAIRPAIKVVMPAASLAPSEALRPQLVSTSPASSAQ